MAKRKKSLFRKVRRSEWGTRITSKFMSGGIKWLSGTLKVDWIDREIMEDLYARDQNFIFGYWHSDLILATRIGSEEVKRRPIAVMASPSRDGAMIAENMASQGLVVVRGSSGRDGANAFRHFAKHLREGMNGSMAVDGPKGPREEVKVGAIRLAQMTQTPVVPFALGYKKRWMTRSWDHLRIPHPYTQATAICGEPFFFPRDMSTEEIEQGTKEFGRALMELRRRLPYDNILE
ncbi:MAG: lysophospholipid acyltransferase family protein [Candidatus Omnitrophica bacterium]|nr:lysophospholipid acyltransferase family protein [Candidatus Omnitrophota bacterium]MCA9432572.1 lysophospholipid acyltransferase family protein [Candidatus Omnitrophota bacterium]MCB9768130.1 lysophospholipid acyltransferase family protein [Candidatus Omnitrophota bacterium]